ncbi:MAG: hypothetical protein IPH79_00605 [Sphingomonadales bacterium]|nr:hypothetical protein [Sphingomonadales bacterium]
MSGREPKYAIGRLVNILTEAHRLQRIIRSNEKDVRLRKKFKLHHMVDTRVVGVLAEPNLHTGLVSPFGTLLQQEGSQKSGQTKSSSFHDIVGDADKPLAEAQAILFANAMLTGELIVRFAQEATNGPLLISPEHISEVFGYISAIEHRSASESNAKANTIASHKNVANELAREVKAIRQSQQPGGEISAEVCQAVVEKLAQLSQAPGMAMRRLEEQFLNGRIANAAQELKFDLSLIAPDEDLVKKWRVRIRQAKRHNPVKPNAHALEADAVTLAQLQLFNIERNDERCVLITDDRGLQEAYFRFLKEPGNAKEFYAIRDPRQYIPIFNIGEDTGKYTDRRVFIAVRDSINRLLTSFASPDSVDNNSSFDGRWSTIEKLIRTNMKNISSEFALEVRSQIRSLSRAWVEMLEHSLVAKADTLLDLADRENRVMLETGIEQSREQLSRRFLAVTESSVLLRNEILILEKRTSPASNNRRMLVSDFGDFKSALFVGRSLDENVGMLKEECADLQISQFHEQFRDERLLVLSCLCLDLGAWDAAQALLAASRPKRGTALAREIDFFRCVSRRLATNSKSKMKQYNDISASLKNLNHGPHPLLRLRVHSEIVAIGLSRWALRVQSKKALNSDLERTAEDWLGLTNAGERFLFDEQAQSAWKGLQKQYALNTFCLVFWLAESRMVIGKKLGQIANTLLQKMELSEFAFIGEGVHGSIYPKLCRYVFTGEPAKPVIAARIVEEICQVTKHDMNEGILFDLPYIDRIELASIRTMLMKRYGFND